MAGGARLRSLDAFRGLTIAAMVVVNSPGNNTAYPLLSHARWNGCTLADLVFPFFLFIVGASLAFARPKPWPEVLRRAAVLCALGLFLNAIPKHDPATFRFAGVLQRIAVCYAACSLLLDAGARSQALLAGGLLAGYAMALAFIPVPGFGPGVLTPEASLSSWLDRLVMGRHTYFSAPFDPEGVLSTLPALATTLLGLLAGRWLRGEAAPGDKCAGLLGAGAVAMVLGWAWGLYLPWNKALWTSSYALYTGGWAAALLGACYGLMDAGGWTAWALPLEVYGTNAIAAYVLHILGLKALVYTRVDLGSGPVSPRLWLCDRLFGTWLAPRDASLAFALAYMLFWLGVLGVLYRKRLFLKV